MDKKYMRVIYGSMIALGGIVLIMTAAETSMLTIIFVSAMWICVIQIIVNYSEMHDNPAPSYFAGLHIFGCIMAVVFSMLGCYWGKELGMMMAKRFF